MSSQIVVWAYLLEWYQHLTLQCHSFPAFVSLLIEVTAMWPLVVFHVSCEEHKGFTRSFDSLVHTNPISSFCVFRTKERSRSDNGSLCKGLSREAW